MWTGVRETSGGLASRCHTSVPRASSTGSRSWRRNAAGSSARSTAWWRTILPLPQFGDTLKELLAQPDVSTVDYHDPGTGHRKAVALLLDHPDWPVFRTWSALPIADGGARNLYLHVYGELARWSIATGKKGVIVGKKMPKLKASLGARMVPQYAAAIPLR
jgi:hypothetical protein